MHDNIECVGRYLGVAHSVALPAEVRQPAGDEVERLCAERDRLRAEVAARDAELERFTYTVAHDLKTPLVALKGFLYLLEKDLAAEDRDRVAADVEQLGRAFDRLQRMLDEILDLTRIGRRANAPEWVSLGALAWQALELLPDEVGGRSVEVMIAPDLPVVAGDRARLGELFRHLLDNAVRFMGDQPAPRVEVGLRRDRGRTVYTVRDNGTGIEPRDREKVFRLFRRLAGGRGGTGAGLALVRRIVEVHGGRVWVESEGPGAGATFCFTLPGRRRDDDDPLALVPGSSGRPETRPECENDALAS